MSADAREKATQSCRIQGIGVSPGVVIGPVFILTHENLSIPERELEPTEVEHEIFRLEDALIETRSQIKRIQTDLQSRTGLSDASIFDAHLMVLDDRAFIEEAVQRVRNERRNVEWVIREVARGYADVLSSVGDDYLRERVADIRDVARRIIRNLIGTPELTLGDLKERRIVVAQDLAPSETASARKDLVLGFATDMGSATSHTALMARALEIPAIVGLHDVTERVSSGDEVLIDGNKGILIINPTAEELEDYGRVAEARRTIEQKLTNLRDEPAVTTDGHRIVLSANAENLEEVDAVQAYGSEGIGLFRSEYLYLSASKAVREEDQFAVYSEVARRLAPAPVIIRTMDIGGDKYVPDAEPWQEMNPFLGCRSIRLSLMYPELFKAQLRAILRANVHGNVKIMYPMISTESEVEQANALLDEAREELTRAGVPFGARIDVGIMIEIPAAALIAEQLAKRVDFFSIGTNDLIQYTIAVDRVNERVAYLYQPTHPAVLNLIDRTVRAGHDNGIWVGTCGEMAANPLMAPLLIGLGVDELSVTPSAVPLIKDAVRGLSLDQARRLATDALAAHCPKEIVAMCRKLMQQIAPELLELI